MILLDTHVVIWLAQEPDRISSKAQSAIREARKKDRGLAVSCITLIEISQLSRDGRIRLLPDPETVMAQVEDYLAVLPINRNIAMQAFELPQRYPNDPAERIIGATSLIQDIPLLTADVKIRGSRAVPTIW